MALSQLDNYLRVGNNFKDIKFVKQFNTVNYQNNKTNTKNYFDFSIYNKNVRIITNNPTVRTVFNFSVLFSLRVRVI